MTIEIFTLICTVFALFLCIGVRAWLSMSVSGAFLALQLFLLGVV